jgi:hypothetical protein
MTSIMATYFIISAVCGAGALLAVPLYALFSPKDRK